MRLIDADAMHKFVEDKVAEGKDGWANGVPYEWAYALTAVDMQATIDPESVMPQWIPVTERLPDRDDTVVVFHETMSDTSAAIQIYKAWAMSDTATHWMPLPEPPKGE